MAACRNTTCPSIFCRSTRFRSPRAARYASATSSIGSPTGGRGRSRSAGRPRQDDDADQKRKASMAVKLRDAFVGWALALVLCSGTAFAQSYPNRPIRLMLPYNPGGIVDYVGRSLGQHLGEALGQT